MRKFILLFIIIIFQFCKSNYSENLDDTIEKSRLSSPNEFSTEITKMEFLIDQIDNYLITVGFGHVNVLTIYDKGNLSKIIDGLNIGDGPDELGHPVSLHVVDRNFYIRDGGYARLLKFNIDSIIFQREIKPIKIVKTPVTGDVIISIMPIEDYFIATTQSKESHFIKFTENGQITSRFGKYEENDNLKEIPDVLYGAFYEGRYSYIKESGKIIKSMMDHDRIEVYNLFGELEKTIDTGNNFNERISFDNRMIVKPDRVISYITYPFITDKYIYLLYFGKLYSQMDLSGYGSEIRVLDQNGKYVRKISLDKGIYDFIIDEENGKLYCVNFNEENPLFYYNLY